MGFEHRQAKLKVIEALELRVKQFRGREDIWPFRVPHQPLDLEEIIDRVVDGEGLVEADALRSRTVLEFHWGPHRWELWVLALPSGILVYCDADGDETRIFASAKRGNPGEADGFFLERLAESRGELFGIEMAGPAPGRRALVDRRPGIPGRRLRRAVRGQRGPVDDRRRAHGRLPRDDRTLARSRADGAAAHAAPEAARSGPRCKVTYPFAVNCPHCQTPLTPGSRFCSSCGRPVEGSDVTVLRTNDVTRPASHPPAPIRRDSGAGGAARTPSSAPASQSGWLTSSGSIDHGRFSPGMVLDNRYRILGLLGRGGMGEV